MGVDHPAPSRFQFGDYVLDLKSATLCRVGEPVHLRPQAFRVLALLVSRAGELVTRDEIRRLIWSADTFVDFNQGLNACIMQIREALDDRADAPRYVETVPRLGYRFVAPVDQERPVADVVVSVPPAVSPSPGTRWRPGVALVGLVLSAGAVFALSGLWPGLQSNAKGAAIRSIAVLPLVNLSGSPESAYVADGMTDALINELARSRGLRVISRTSSMQYRDSAKPVVQIARELNVDAVIEGSVQASAGRVRITVQLIDGMTDQPLWASSYDRRFDDILALQRHVSDVIVREIRAELPVEGAQPQKSVVPEAYEAYLRGRFFWAKRTSGGYEQAIRHFEEAIAADPHYGPAYSGLADTLTLFTNTTSLMPRDVGYRRAKEMAQKALSLDETLAEAHTSLGFVLHLYELDWAGAERAFVRAIELNPNYATAHHWRATNFTVLGRFDDAYASLREAVERDPVSYAINVELGEAMARVGRCDEGQDQAAKTEQMHPLTHRSLVGEMLVYCGKYDDAITLLEGIAEPGKSWSKNIGFLGYAYARAGRVKEAQQAIARLNASGAAAASLYAAEIYGALGETDLAFERLEQLYQSKDDTIRYLNVHQMLDPIRQDPRFQVLLQRLNVVPPSRNTG